MRAVCVHMENGDYIVTRINGTEDEIKRYYVGQPYIYEDERRGEYARTRFTRVEFLD